MKIDNTRSEELDVRSFEKSPINEDIGQEQGLTK